MKKDVFDFPSEEPYYGSAAPLVPDGGLDAVARAAAECRACHLWRLGTQTVFGEGKEKASVMMVGEQPGDKEDLQGRPFVGPAGQLLDRALEEAGLRRENVYLTNAVKHFKWTPQGNRRLHAKPNRQEVKACSPWLMAELGLVQPDVLVALGATAAQALLGPEFKLTQNRGRFVESDLAKHVIATLHPSAILRSRSPEERETSYQGLVADLRLVAAKLGNRGYLG